MIFLAPQLPHSQIDAALAAAPVVRSFSPDTGGKAQVAAGTTITLPPQSSRFALWLRTTAAARVLASPSPISVYAVGGDSPVPSVLDENMPYSLDLRGYSLSDLTGIVSGEMTFPALLGSDVFTWQTDFSQLPLARPADENVMSVDAMGREDSVFLWRDGDELKIDHGDRLHQPAGGATFKSVQFQVRGTTIPQTWGGASVPNNAPLHRAEGAMLGIFPANATFTLTFEDDAEIRNLVYSEIIGELRDYPRVRGVMDRRERTSMGLTGLVHVRRLSDARLNCSLELSNHNEEDARLLEHLAALDGFGVVPNGGRSNAEGATWARANVCRFVRARGYSGFVGWGDVNDLGATGKITLSEVPEFVGEVAPYVPPQRGDYLLLPDGIDKLILADGDGALLLAAA